MNVDEIGADTLAFQVVAASPASLRPSYRPANDCATSPASPSIVLAGAAGRRAPRLPTPRRIAVGIDFSPASEAARRLAAGIAASSQALLDLVHVMDAFTEVFIHENRRVIERSDSMPHEIERALAHRQQLALADGVRCVYTNLAGAPGVELGRHATATSADLIVLGIPAHEQPARFGWTWGRRAADQMRRAGSWKGLVLVLKAPR
jgi:nucleotide-binding universal stress UspA family protein